MSEILKYAGKYKKLTLGALFILILSVIASVVPYYFLYRLLLPLLNHESTSWEYVISQILPMGLCVLLNMILYSLGLLLSHHGAYGTLKNLRVSLQSRMEKLPLGVIQDLGNGQIKKIFTDDIDSIELLLAHQIPEGISNLIVSLGLLVVMFISDWRLALTCLGTFVLATLAMSTMGKIGYNGMNRYYEASRRMNNTIIEYINGMEVVKIFNRDGDSYKRFKDDVLNYRDYTLSWYKACWPWMAVYFSILPCLTLIALPLGTGFYVSGSITLAKLALVMCMGFALTTPLLKVSAQAAAMPQVRYKVNALEQLLDAQPLKQSERPFEGKDYSIEFDHVSFSYREDEVIHDVSFVIKEHTMNALIGPSGSGKSTLAKLLVHFYDVSSGRILIGGQDITDMRITSLNEQISYVSQEQFLFNTSIYDNIRLGKLNATDEEIRKAAERAQCTEFIANLPNGIHTRPGDAGKALSGGERQRVALARAILKNAPIIILDEATAFIDPENEEKMNRAIREVIRDKTVIVIAHRLQSIMNASQIILLEDGRLSATGTHRDLLKENDVYRRLWDASLDSSGWKITNRGEERC